MKTTVAIQEIMKANNWEVLSDKKSFWQTEKQVIQVYKMVITGKN